jgi:outer membrane protein TolC
MATRMLVLGLTLVAAAATTRADESPPQPYDLGACVRDALRNDPDLGTAAADVAAARARLAEAAAGRYGQLEYRQLLGLVNEAHGNVLFSPNNKNDFFQGLGPFTKIDLAITIPVWTFGKLDAALRAAEDGLRGEVAHGDARRADVVLNVKRLYYSLLLSRQLSAVLHDMLDTLDKAVRKTQERLDGGSKSVTELDVLKLKAGRARFAKAVAEVDGSIDLTRSALARSIGVPEHGFEIADKKLQPCDVALAPMDVYLQAGPEHRPEVKQLASGIAAQEARVDEETAGYYPDFFVATGVEYSVAGNRTEQDNPFVYDNFNYVRPVFVLGMHWDLNIFRTGAKIDEARADLQRLQAQQRDATSGMQLEIRRAYTEVVQARNTIRATEDGRKAGRAMLVLTVANFDLGIGEADDLFNGLGTYTETSTDYLRAVYDYNVAVGSLSKAINEELTSLQY